MDVLPTRCRNGKNRPSAAVLATCILVLWALPAAAQAVVQDVPIPGGSEPMLYAGPPRPPAIVFVFAGGDGTVAFNAGGQIAHMNGNFVLRTEPLWLGHGFGFATIGSSASLMGRRHTPAYAQAIAAAIDDVRARGGGAPVWLVGTSTGSIAAANGAAHLPGRVAGVVLTSSVAAPNRNGETVFDSDLGAIAVPALVVANKGDTCPDAGPGLAPQILAALARSAKKELVYVESRQLQSEPCEAMSPHGYLGIEGPVVQRIADWIRTASGG